MTELITIGEATSHSSYSHVHIIYLVKKGKVKGRKSGSIWMIDLDSLKEYEQRMTELGNQKHTPSKFDNLN